jgi:hypothetical protein
MKPMKTDRLNIVETPTVMSCLAGRFDCVIVNATEASPIAPSFVAASMLLVRLKPDLWMLQHLLVEDDLRRNGFGTELIRFYQDRLGPMPAAWVSDSGIAFARAYVAKHGDQPHWQIGQQPDHEIVESAQRIARNLCAGGQHR